MAVPVALYSLLLTGTAATAAGLGLRTGIGGALFFVSDGLIALRRRAFVRPLRDPTNALLGHRGCSELP